MLKKIVTVYLAILFTVTFFDVSLPTLPELLPKFSEVTLQNELHPAAPGVTTIKMGDKSVYLGESLDDVLACCGEAADVLPSEYGFSWYIFHNSYKDYIQIGFTNDRVVAIYTNAPDFLVMGLKPGVSRNTARLLFGDLTFEIKKKSARYQKMKADTPAAEGDLFFTGDAYIHVFYDIFKNDSVTSVNIIAKETEEGFDELYGTPSRALAESFEKQSYYVTNALRVREGKEALVWSEELKRTALAHAADMATHDYFSHEDRSGRRPSDRISAAGILYRLAGENLAMGAQNPLIMHELLMNSEGHRKNLLADYRFMGVGVSFRADRAPFLAQNFIIPPVTFIG